MGYDQSTKMDAQVAEKRSGRMCKILIQSSRVDTGSMGRDMFCEYFIYLLSRADNHTALAEFHYFSPRFALPSR